MARSFWKGKSFIKEFIEPSYIVRKNNILSTFKRLKVENQIILSEGAIYAKRRNHIFLFSQYSILKKLLPYYLYNGYDFFVQRQLPNDLGFSSPLNLATIILTRESDVNHKVKLTKAARKKMATRKIAKKTPSQVKTKSMQNRKVALAKKFRK